MHQERQREKWSSWLGFVFVATGAAVGLGNVWKFPYMAGSSGGSLFVLLYLAFVVLIAMPVMAAEIMLGKVSQRNAIDGFAFLAAKSHRSQAWRFTAYLGLTTLQLVFCFYSVVAGWSIGYLYFGATNTFFSQSPEAIKNIWSHFLSDPLVLCFCTILFVFFTMSIVYLGIKKGIERACTWMMPALLLVLAVLVFYAADSDGFGDAFRFLFAIDATKIDASVAIAALGHAFFTLAVGACAMMVYGSYLPKRFSVAKSVMVVAILDVFVALLSGLAIFPLTFEHGLSPGQGPGLMFVTLPIVFATMPFGWLWGTLFFLLLFFAALSSALSFAEPLVDAFMEKLGIARRYAVILVGFITIAGSTLCAFSFNILSDVKILHRLSIFDLVADLSTNFLLPLGGIAISVFAGLVIKPNDFSSHQNQSLVAFRLWRTLTLYVAPCAISIVLLNTVWDLIAQF